MKHYFGAVFPIKHFWYRYEWQERGSGHVHGFVWLKDAPNPDDINWDFIKNRLPIPDEQLTKMERFRDYWDKIVTAFNPFPRQDENTPLVGRHPCSLDRDSAQNTKTELAELLNWVERHTKCLPGYCQVKRKVPGQQEPRLVCRFDYPMPLGATPVVGCDSKQRIRFEPRRNDPLLNNYNA